MNLNHLSVFIEIAKHKTMVNASRSLGIPNSTVGRQLSQLETELGVRLFFRNTRHINLTQDGKELLERTVHLIEELNEVENNFFHTKKELSGRINVSIPNEYGSLWFATCIAKFAKSYPLVSISCSTSMASVDPISEEMDLSIIYHRGIPNDSSLVMQNLATIPSVIVGSKNIIEKHGLPTDITELKKLPCISTWHALRANPWHFIDINGDSVSHKIKSVYRADSTNLIISAAIEGVGFAIIPRLFCKQYIDQNVLVEIDIGLQPAPLHVAAVLPDRVINLRTKYFLETIKKTMIEILDT